jgi:EAL domain-containing protein (putative c-di-GMP-specific phosphodiesterase class I)
MMTGYAKSQNIKTTSVNVLTLKEAQIMVDRGVDVIQGPAASEPKRIATLAMKAIKKLPFGK